MEASASPGTMTFWPSEPVIAPPCVEMSRPAFLRSALWQLRQAFLKIGSTCSWKLTFAGTASAARIRFAGTNRAVMSRSVVRMNTVVSGQDLMVEEELAAVEQAPEEIFHEARHVLGVIAHPTLEVRQLALGGLSGQ